MHPRNKQKNEETSGTANLSAPPLHTHTVVRPRIRKGKTHFIRIISANFAPLPFFLFCGCPNLKMEGGGRGGRGEALILSCQLSFSHFTPLGSNPLLHLFLSLVLGEILVCILFRQFECYKIPLEIIDRAKRSQKYLTKKSCML